MKTIKVVFLEPFKEAEVREIDASLKGMQKAVRGCIEAAYYFEGTECVICNDEGKINGMSLKVMYDVPAPAGKRRRQSKTFPAGTPKAVVEQYKREKEIEIVTGDIMESEHN